jgi:uncharacterized protein YbjT (DUF2867 family)
MPDRSVLVTGATGHVGGLLLPSLAGKGVPVRALTRDAASFAGPGGVEVAEGDVADAASVRRALEGIRLAYYLVHSLGAADFAEADRTAATTFAEAALDAGVERIVYLGGIGSGELSPHLASRQEVGRILRESGVPTVELRASVVIGDGSASFDAFRTLVDAFPVVVCPDWANNASQPIAAGDVVTYLSEAGELELDGSEVFEVGGADRVPYVEIMREYARQAGKTRVITTAPVPPGATGLTALLKPFEPERARVLTDLFDSLRIDTAVTDDRASRRFAVRPLGLVEAVAAVLEGVR